MFQFHINKFFLPEPIKDKILQFQRDSYTSQLNIDYGEEGSNAMIKLANLSSGDN